MTDRKVVEADVSTHTRSVLVVHLYSPSSGIDWACRRGNMRHVFTGVDDADDMLCSVRGGHPDCTTHLELRAEAHPSARSTPLPTGFKGS
jgi:hypothetical protein